ncbi:EMILIN-3 [Microcaecilia unicolor]|uniref:EMILIN-3 n=1 Tax=Microcaecilia unicolor TaxID=1415580 RepID=A0A6P7YZH4_9AMPH|nr:EMILIN-3 [Microcaecilia unicolor]
MSRTSGSFKKSLLVPMLPWIGTFLSLLDAKGTYYRYPQTHGNRYSLYTSGSSPQLNPGKPVAKHKNFCVYVVQKNITCTQQEGTETYVKAEYLKCTWGPKCPGTVVYRTLYRPKYIIGYKAVTELAWRCCPGFTGEGCHEDPTQQPGLLTHFPSPKIPPVSNMFPGPKIPPSHPKLHPEPFPGPPSPPKKSDYGRKVPGFIEERFNHLEEEIRGLSRSYNSLHNMVNGLGDHLRHVIQEDTNKMIGNLMNTPRVPDSSVGFGIIPGGVLDAPEKADVTFPRVGDIMGKVTEVSDMLKTKTDLLDEVHGMVLDHDGRIKHLLDAAKPSPLTSMDILEEFIERKLASVRAEILDGFEKKLLNIQSTCDFRIKEVQEQCEQEKAANLRLQQSLDGKELQIKKEISHLESQIHGLTVVESCCSNINYLSERLDSLEKNMHSIAESQKNQQSRLDSELSHVSSVTLENFFNGRFEDIEAKINATEREMDGRCHEIEGGMRGLVGLEVDSIKISIEDKIRTLEERFMTIVGELGNISMPVSLDGAAMPLLENEITTMKKQTSERIEVLQNRLTVLESLCTQSCSSSSSAVETFRTDIEGCQNRSQDLLLRLDVNSELLKKLNSTILEIQRQIQREEANSLQGEITLLKINLNTVSKSLTGLKDSVNLYSDTVVHMNSSFDERERKISGEVHSIQDQVQDQGSQLLYSNRNVLNLKGDLEKLKARILNDLGNCKHLAQDLQKEVFQFDSRMAQVENTCGNLGAVTGSLDLIKDELEKHTGGLWGYMDHVNGTLEVHAQEITSLKDNLLDCQAKVREISEQFSASPVSLQHKKH